MIACFDIGGSAIKAAVASDPSAIEVVGSVPTPLLDFEQFVDAIRGLIPDAVPPSQPIAVAIAGVVNPADGRIKIANIPCLDRRQLASELGSQLRRPVAVANDADCFTLAEAGQGAGRGHRVVFGVILGTGVGGGLVIDGRLVQGAGGFAGEWGHGPVAATVAGEPPVTIPKYLCGCGQTGCIDTVGGARGLERLHEHLHGDRLASRLILDAWERGDRKAARTVEIYTELVAGPLSLVMNVVGADIVPVGGGLGNSRALVKHLDRAVRSRILRQTIEPLLVPAQCRIEPGLVGAAALAFAEAARVRAA